MQFRVIVLALAVALLGLVPSTAAAQGWLADRDRAEGPGIRLGDFELHPGIGAEIGWDSNVYYTDDNNAFTDVVDSGILRITPHILVSTIGQARRTEGEGQAEATPPPVQFRGGLSGSYYEFFAAPERRNVSFDLGLNLRLFEAQTVSFTIFNNLGRSVRPFAENSAQASYARIREEAGLDVTFASSGGVLQVGAGYTFGLDYFESDLFSYARNMNHSIRLTEAFRFLPHTALVHETEVAIRDYYEPNTLATNPATPTGVRVKSMLGVNGAITNEISLLVQGGYGAGFFNAIGPAGGPAVYDQDYDTFLARAELRWRASENFRLAFGYDRSVFPSFIGNYYTQDRGYANTQLMFGGSFLLGAELSVGYYDYGQIVAATGSTMIGNSTERTDVRFIGDLFAEYRFTEWLGVNGTFRYTGDYTDFEYNRDLGSLGVVPDPAGYNKVELWLGVRVFY